jgi:PAS domain S-box-containing protein
MPQSDLRVLLVDDNPAYAQALARRLTRLSAVPCIVTHALTLEVARPVLKDHHVDVILFGADEADPERITLLRRLAADAVLVVICPVGQPCSVDVHALDADDCFAHDLDDDDLLRAKLKRWTQRRDHHRRKTQAASAFQRAVDQSPNAILITDHAGHIEYVNPQFTELTGYARDEVIGQNPRILKSNHTPSELYSEMWRTITQGEVWRGELINRKKNGALFWEHAVISGLKDDSGEITHYLAVKENITDRKRMENALAESEKRYRAMFQNHHAVMLIVAAETGQIVDANDAACDFYGYDAAAFQSMNEDSLVVLPPEHIAERRRQTSEQRGATYLTRHRLASGAVRDVEIRATRVDFNDVPMLYQVINDVSERKRAERALRDSEARFRTLVNSMDDLIFTLDTTQRYTGVFGRWLEKAGVSSDYFVGRTALDILGPADGAVHEAANVRALNGDTVRYEWSSQDHQYETVVSPLRDGAGGITGIVGIVRDVTASKAAERRQRIVNQRLALLNQILTMANSSLDAAQMLQTACERLAQVLNVDVVTGGALNPDADTLLLLACHDRDGRACLDGVERYPLYQYPALAYIKPPFVIEDASSDPVARAYAMLIPENTVTLLMLPLINHHRVVGYMSLNMRAKHWFNDDDITLAHEVARVLAPSLENAMLNRHLEEHNQHLEASIRERTAQVTRMNDRLSTILNATSDAIVVLWADGLIENTNPAFDQLFGYGPDEAFNANVTALVAPEDGDALREAVQAVLDGSPPHNLQLMGKRKDGSLFDTDIAVASLPDEEPHVILSARDITHLKEVERMKDRFISMVSHELRTPTTSIVLSANSLRSYYDRITEEQRRTLIDRLMTQSTLLSEMVEGILEISRLDSKTAAPHRMPCRMPELAEQTLSEFQTEIRMRGHVIRTAFSGDHVTAMGERMDFGRVWRNLISNALKYTPDGGTIYVRVGTLTVTTDGDFRLSESLRPDSLELPIGLEPGHYVIGQVEDTGHGIPEENARQLFTRFYRGWAGQSSIPGSGLGLSLVRELINRYEGDIAVKSEVGVGSIFSFWIPVESTDTQVENHES